MTIMTCTQAHMAVLSYVLTFHAYIQPHAFQVLSLYAWKMNMHAACISCIVTGPQGTVEFRGCPPGTTSDWEQYPSLLQTRIVPPTPSPFVFSPSRMLGILNACANWRSLGVPREIGGQFWPLHAASLQKRSRASRKHMVKCLNVVRVSASFFGPFALWLSCCSRALSRFLSLVRAFALCCVPLLLECCLCLAADSRAGLVFHQECASVFSYKKISDHVSASTLLACPCNISLSRLTSPVDEIFPRWLSHLCNP